MPIAIAIAISALLHAAAIVMPGWDLPGDGEAQPPAIAAQLAPPPVPHDPPRPRPAAARKAKTAVAATAAEPAAAPDVPAAVVAAAEPDVPAAVVAAAEPDAPALADESPAPAAADEPDVPAATEPAPAVPEALPAAAAAPPPPPPAPPWPRSGRVRYVVTYGDLGFVIGETIQEWRVEDGHYAIRSVAEPMGLAALRGVTRTQSSEGEVTAAGLRPHEFRDRREGREQEAVAFDWSAGRVSFSGGRGESPLAADTQDLISVFYQLAWLAPRQDVELAVATASRVGRWTFEWLGEEELALAAGTLTTLHLRTRADGDTTEIWLAPAHGGLPVKIRHVDRKGDVFEQAADSLELN